MASPYINDQAARTETATALARLLADSYMLYLKTHGFQWNVVGRSSSRCIRFFKSNTPNSRRR
jgi:DNA-binding ferritin-like protein